LGRLQLPGGREPVKVDIHLSDSEQQRIICDPKPQETKVEPCSTDFGEVSSRQEANSSEVICAPHGAVESVDREENNETALHAEFTIRFQAQDTQASQNYFRHDKDVKIIKNGL
jgi:hypothetical protein